MEVTIARHCVPQGADGLSPLQHDLLHHAAPVRIAAAPTGAGKSYAFQRAVLQGQRIFFMVPTRRLAQNLVRAMLDDLTANAGWSADKARRKVVLWTSDASAELREQGIQIGPHRVRQIAALDPATALDGELIVAVPETLSHLLVSRRLAAGQSSVGLFDLLNGFEHIVFDEFHTIEPRGFGLAAVIARAAISDNARAKVSFLSATPLEIRPVLEKLGCPAEGIVDLQEALSETGRAVHGDVQLCLEESDSLADLLEAYGGLMADEIRQGRQVVAIYNALADLQRQIPRLERLAEHLGLDPARVLLVNSIDDSRQGQTTHTRFATGRQRDPEAYDLLLATASVEMGVTFNANLLFMEPGFSPLNFLQRYGRAARRDQPGSVLVRLAPPLLDKNDWLRKLARWVGEHHGSVQGIQELTAVLTGEVRRRFRPQPEARPNTFGALPNRAAYAAGLYWLALLKHPSNKGHRRKRLEQLLPKPAKTVRGLLYKVRELEQDPEYAASAKAWIRGFEEQALTLRDIGPKVRVRIGGGETLYLGETWLRRHTDLAGYPMMIAEDGEEEIRLPEGDSLQSHMPDQSAYIQETRTVMFPHTPHTAELKDGPDLPRQWKQELRGAGGIEDMAWELYPDAMAAAESLTLMTGLVVSPEEQITLDSPSAVL